MISRSYLTVFICLNINYVPFFIYSTDMVKGSIFYLDLLSTAFVISSSFIMAFYLFMYRFYFNNSIFPLT